MCHIIYMTDVSYSFYGICVINKYITFARFCQARAANLPRGARGESAKLSPQSSAGRNGEADIYT